MHPDHQGQGRGAALLRHIEQELAQRGELVLLVETSGLPNFERTRSFYRQCGDDEEARIREFYQAGEDKIVFRKALSGARLTDAPICESKALRRLRQVLPGLDAGDVEIVTIYPSRRLLEPRVRRFIDLLVEKLGT